MRTRLFAALAALITYHWSLITPAFAQSRTVLNNPAVQTDINLAGHSLTNVGGTGGLAVEVDANGNVTNSTPTDFPSGMLEINHVPIDSLTTAVQSLTVTTANGISGSFTSGTTPALTLALGAITPARVTISDTSTFPFSVTSSSATATNAYLDNTAGANTNLQFLHNTAAEWSIGNNVVNDRFRILNSAANSSTEVPRSVSIRRPLSGGQSHRSRRKQDQCGRSHSAHHSACCYFRWQRSSHRDPGRPSLWKRNEYARRASREYHDEQKVPHGDRQRHDCRSARLVFDHGRRRSGFICDLRHRSARSES
jgi:hypothetical protein